MTSASDLTRMVPGFDFLQGLMKSGGAGLPSIGQWIAPTLEPEELGKRIDELRTVQFWLEQNAKLLGTTITALEVQRMTLATLKGMNMPLADLTNALKIGARWPASDNKPATASAKASAKPAAAPISAANAEQGESNEAGQFGGPGKTSKSGKGADKAAVDPMQWWGALTQQFTELATKAMRDGGADMARNLAGAMVKPGGDALSTSIERAMAMPAKAAQLVSQAAKAAGAGSATKAAKSVKAVNAANASGAAGPSVGSGARTAPSAAKRRKV